MTYTNVIHSCPAHACLHHSCVHRRTPAGCSTPICLFHVGSCSACIPSARVSALILCIPDSQLLPGSTCCAINANGTLACKIISRLRDIFSQIYAKSACIHISIATKPCLHRNVSAVLGYTCSPLQHAPRLRAPEATSDCALIRLHAFLPLQCLPGAAVCSRCARELMQCFITHALPSRR